MLRFVVAIGGGALAVCVLTLIAVGIYALFPHPDEVIEVTPIVLDQVITDSDYKLEGLVCECQSDKLEYERQMTASGLGCKTHLLSVKQLQSLPECQLEPQHLQP
jgi:hypothetical protein